MNFQHLDRSGSSEVFSAFGAFLNSLGVEVAEGLSFSSSSIKNYCLILNPLRISRISLLMFFLYSMNNKGYELKTRHAKESSDIIRIAPLELDKDERTL